MTEYNGLFIITSLKGGNKTGETEILENPIFQNHWDIASLKLQCNTKRAVFLINTDLPLNRGEPLLEKLSVYDEHYPYHTEWSNFIAQIPDLKQNNRVSVALLIHFGGNNPRLQARRIQERLDSVNSQNCNIKIIPYSSFLHEKLGVLALSKVKAELSRGNDGFHLFELASKFEQQDNIYEKEQECLEADQVTDVLGLEEVLIPAIKPEDIFFEKIESETGSFPKFLDPLVQDSRGRDPVRLYYLDLNSMIKKNHLDHLFHIRDLLNDAFLTSPAPVIFLGYFDLEDPHDMKLLHNYFDQRFLFFDSSIWTRYVSIKKLSKLKKIGEEITFNYEMGYYDLNAALEFLEFCTRLFDNSFLKSQSNTYSHAGMIVPFSFHSETVMDLRSDIIADRILKEFKDNWEWNLLFFDDHANQNLMSETTSSGPTKWQIIEKILKLEHVEDKVVNGEDIKVYKFEKGSNFKLKVNFISGFEEGKQIIDNILEKNSDIDTFYDIILLDYLFVEGDGVHKYGDEAIEQLLDTNTIKRIKDEKFGPLQKLWIFPISIYQDAFVNKLRNRGLPFYGGDTVIIDGADPISTPHLFRYRFLQTLELQLKEVKGAITNKTFRQILQEGEKCGSYLEVKKWADKYYSDIVMLGVQFRTFCNFRKNSAFANSALDALFYKLYNVSDWYHVQNLFYLLAYESVHKEPQILEELFYIFKSMLDENPLFEKLNTIILKKYEFR